ncbi:MAG: hypothetical protein K2U26_19730 [Cyclobacteriaceae bacterium]|nr:hypothetical protein [Cyclobacteriaceae bacterium]
MTFRSKAGFACLALLAMLLSLPMGYAQPGLPALQYVESPPGDLLAARSVVIHDYNFTQAELEETQRAFQQIGIDGEAYFDRDVLLAGTDVTKAFAEYFIARQFKYLVLLEKTKTGFAFTCTLFNQKSTLAEAGQPAWRVERPTLREMLTTVFQDSWRSQKKQNFLVNDFPERDITINPIKGNRQEFYAIDLKVDNLAVPRFGNEAMDRELEQFFLSNYPLKYKLTPAGADEQELRRQGFQYVLCLVHTRGKAAREILGYDMTKGENAYASITFPGGPLQLKTIPANETIYKFYFRHIDNGNVFLGTKWDADVTWQEALRNHIGGFKIEAKIN